MGLRRFDGICFHKTDKGNVIDEFTLFAKVISQTDKEIMYERYQNFGKIKWEKPVTIPIFEFEKYYVAITDEIFEIIKEVELLQKED